MDREVYKFVKLCKNLRVDYAQLRPSFGEVCDYDSIGSYEWENIFKDLKKYETDSFKVVIDKEKFQKILSGSTTRNYNYCHAQSFKSTSITATGGVFICCSLSGVLSGYIGNILYDSFCDIWNGDKRKKVLESLDLSKCPSLCVGDNLNEFLQKFKKGKTTHKNFL